MIDEISLPLRDIKNLRSKSAMDRAWMVNNSIYQTTSKEPHSTLEATKPLIEILDAKNEKAHLRTITKGGLPVSPQCNRKEQVAEAPARM